MGSLDVTTPEAGNIAQRVFRAFPDHPSTLTIWALYALLPCFAPRSIQSAVDRLCRAGALERAPGARHTYRRTAFGACPPERRGGARRRGGNA